MFNETFEEVVHRIENSDGFQIFKNMLKILSNKGCAN